MKPDWAGLVSAILTIAALAAVIYLALVGHSSEAIGALIATLTLAGRRFLEPAAKPKD